MPPHGCHLRLFILFSSTPLFLRTKSTLFLLTFACYFQGRPGPKDASMRARYEELCDELTESRFELMGMACGYFVFDFVAMVTMASEVVQIAAFFCGSDVSIRIWTVDAVVRKHANYARMRQKWRPTTSSDVTWSTSSGCSSITCTCSRSISCLRLARRIRKFLKVETCKGLFDVFHRRDDSNLQVSLIE